MKHFLIVYHKNSGKGNAALLADKLRIELEKHLVICMMFNSKSVKSMFTCFTDIAAKNYEDLTIVLMGGDGSAGLGIDAIIKSGLNCKVAIFKAGTVNDFGSYLKMPTCIKRYTKMLIKGKTKPCDIALANGNYFVNVACGGYFTHGLNSYSRADKKLFGKFAYYSKNVGTMFKMKPHKLIIEVDGATFEEELYFYLIVNSCSAGGFKCIGTDSKIDDGMFDFVGIKPAKLGRLASIFFRILKGKHKTCGEVVYLQGKNFKLSCEKTDPHFKYVDTDGNRSVELPLEVQVINKKLEIVVKE